MLHCQIIGSPFSQPHESCTEVHVNQLRLHYRYHYLALSRGASLSYPTDDERSDSVVRLFMSILFFKLYGSTVPTANVGNGTRNATVIGRWRGGLL